MARGMGGTTQQHTEVTTASKKDQIISLFREAGVTHIDELALLTDSTPSYIAQVLRDAKVLSGYFDLYTSSERPMNVYSRFFAKKLGFKDMSTATRSVRYINMLYTQFERIGDRAGQHHALLMALTMRNRAVWSKKPQEAALFARWLIEKLAVPNTAPALSPGIQKMEHQLRRNEHTIRNSTRKYLRG